LGAAVLSQHPTNDKQNLLSLAGSSGESNKFTALSLGADYKIMPGMLAYVEYTDFKYSMNKDYLSPDARKNDIKLNKGNVILTGVKFEF
jgi:predicted porin